MPHLVNLTNTSNVLLRYPTWSPKQDLVAFIANGVASNGSDVLNTVNADPTQYNLYTMELDGSGLLSYQTKGSVQGLCWCPNGVQGDNSLLYVTQREGAQYTIRSVDPVAQTVSVPLYTTSNQLGVIGMSPNNLGVLYFEMQTGGNWNIYDMPAASQFAGFTPTALTSINNNRHPAFCTYDG